MKKRQKVVSDGAVPSEGEVAASEDSVDCASLTQSPSKEQGVESEVTEGELFMCSFIQYTVLCKSIRPL